MARRLVPPVEPVEQSRERPVPLKTDWLPPPLGPVAVAAEALWYRSLWYRALGIDHALRIAQQIRGFRGILANQHGAIDIFDGRLRGSGSQIELRPAHIGRALAGLSWIAL